MNVYVWTSWELKNAYIGQYWWKPWANTIAYYPFISDILDHSWNNKDFSWSWYSFSNNTITVSSILIAPLVTPENTTWDRTIHIRMINPVSGSKYHFRYRNNDGTNWNIDWKDYENWDRPWASLKTSNTRYRNRPSSVSIWNKFLMTRTKTGTTMKLYLNWVLASTTSLWTDIWWWPTNTDSRLAPWTYWEIIVENRARTAQEISDYYEATKDNYQGG